MSIPTIFGLPIYTGLKKRIANKWVNKFRLYKIYRQHFNYNPKIGDLVCDCSSLNIKVVDAQGEYREIGKGKVLWDVTLESEHGGYCSFRNCGVEPPITYEQAEQTRERIINRGPSEWNFDIGYSKEVLTINPDGTFVKDYEKQKELIKQREGK